MLKHKFKFLAWVLCCLCHQDILQAEGVLDSEKIQLPEMGDSTGLLLSPAQEQELGAEFFRQIHSQAEVNQDPEVQHYIEGIGKRLAENSDTPSYPFHFFVVSENEINAFAGPGGYIGVNAGLIMLTEFESELAAVMAHEIAHVTQRHLYRSAEAAQRMTIPTLAAMIAAALIGSQSPQAGQAAIMAIQAGNVQFQIDFTRAHEQEADRVGMQTLSKAQYDPRSMPTFFERMQQSTRYYGRNVPEFLRTHPVTENRISDTRGRADQYPYRQYPSSLNYQLVKTKLMVLNTKDEGFGAYLQKLSLQGTLEQRTAARYGLALLALKKQNYAVADQILAELAKQYPDYSQFPLAQAKVALESKNFDKSLKILRDLNMLEPFNQAIKVEYVNALLKTNQAEEARKVLHAAIKEEAQAVYLSLLAQAYSDLGQSANSHRYSAEYYYSTGRTDLAIQQILLAKKTKDLNFYTASILEDRLNFFINEERERRRN